MPDPFELESRTPSSHRDRILELLGESSYDDDELAERLGIRPRQKVNQVCRGLASEGLVLRELGPRGKLVNVLASGIVEGKRVDQSEALEPSELSLSNEKGLAGSSQEQRNAERVMLEVLASEIGVPLGPRRYLHPSGARVELDGASQDLSVLVECWAHQGPAKVAQKYKLVNDAFKLAWVAKSLPRPSRLILCVSDEAAVRHLRGRSWQGQAIADAAVEIVVIRLPNEVVTAVKAAQARQFR